MFVTSVSNKIKCRPIRTRQIGGNPILLNLSTTFCTIMSGEAHHHFQLGLDDLNLHFLWILVLQKTHFLLKLIFRATELYQRTKFDTFEKSTILHLSVKCKFGTKHRSNCSKAVSMERFYFFLLSTDHFGSFHGCSKKE